MCIIIIIIIIIINKRGAGRLHNYLHILSPGGAFSVISFRMVVFLTLGQITEKVVDRDHSVKV